VKDKANLPSAKGSVKDPASTKIGIHACVKEEDKDGEPERE